MLNAKLRGHYQYYGRPTNYRNLEKFAHAVRRIWRWWLARTTRGRCLPWPRFNHILARYPLLRPRIAHLWQSVDTEMMRLVPGSRRVRYGRAFGVFVMSCAGHCCETGGNACSLPVIRSTEMP